MHRERACACVCMCVCARVCVCAWDAERQRWEPDRPRPHGPGAPRAARVCLCGASIGWERRAAVGDVGDVGRLMVALQGRCVRVCVCVVLVSAGSAVRPWVTWGM